MTGLPRGYDDWRTRSPEDQYAIDHPEKYRRGKYTVTIERTMTITRTVEVEASSDADACEDAIIAAKKIPFNMWDIDQDDYDVLNLEGPPERDPDDARDDRQDREYDR